MKKSNKIFIAGASGMVGSAIVRNLISSGYNNLVGSYHSTAPDNSYFFADSNSTPSLSMLRNIRLDLTCQSEVDSFFNTELPDYVFLAAATVGGINANRTYPAQFIYNNLAIQNNVIHAAYKHGVKRLLFLGSSCIYPKNALQPMKEEYLLSGYLEPTNPTTLLMLIAKFLYPLTPV